MRNILTTIKGLLPILAVIYVSVSETTVLATSPSPPPSVTVDLSISKPPALGDIVTISMKVALNKKRNNDCPDTVAQIKLPDGFQVVDGDPYWKGTVSKSNPPIEVKVLAKAISKGEWQIEGRATWSAPGLRTGDVDYLNVAIFSEKGFVTRDRDIIFPSNYMVDGVAVRSRPSVSTVDQTVLVSCIDLVLKDHDEGEISYQVTALQDAPNTKINVTIPDGLRLSGEVILAGDTDMVSEKEVEWGMVLGPMSWSGDMKKGARLELRGMVRPTKFGKWAVIGTATPNLDGRALTTAALQAYVLEEPRFSFFPLNLFHFLTRRYIAFAAKEPVPGSIRIDTDVQPTKIELKLNQTAELVFSTKAPACDIPEAVTETKLPPGLQLVAGQLRWQGSITKNELITRTITVKASLPGDWELQTSAGYYLGGQYLKAVGNGNNMVYITTSP